MTEASHQDIEQIAKPGQMLAGKYLVERLLGVGGMGAVVAATHTQLDQRVAIKFLLPAMMGSREVVEVPRPEAEPAAGRDRGEVGQRAVLECVDLERARVLRLAWRGVVAARHQDRGPVAGGRAHLMRVNAGVGLARLADRTADRAVAGYAMHRDVARRIVGGEQIVAARVDAGAGVGVSLRASNQV